jgi:hypothetical protein
LKRHPKLSLREAQVTKLVWEEVRKDLAGALLDKSSELKPFIPVNTQELMKISNVMQQRTTR